MCDNTMICSDLTCVIKKLKKQA